MNDDWDHRIEGGKGGTRWLIKSRPMAHSDHETFGSARLREDGLCPILCLVAACTRMQTPTQNQQLSVTCSDVHSPVSIGSSGLIVSALLRSPSASSICTIGVYDR
jgi:hypothetical protein